VLSQHGQREQGDTSDTEEVKYEQIGFGETNAAPPSLKVLPKKRGGKKEAQPTEGSELPTLKLEKPQSQGGNDQIALYRERIRMMYKQNKKAKNEGFHL